MPARIPLAQSIQRRGNLAATFELYDDGHTRAGLAHAIEIGHIIRVRQGWYALAATSPILIAAARVGGRLTCMTGLGAHGLWQHPHAGLHIAVDAHACRLRSPRDKRVRLSESLETRIHWRTAESQDRLLVDPIGCLEDLIRCQPPEVIAASAESVLHHRPHLRAAWLSSIDRAPDYLRESLRRLDGVCESGTESLLFHRLARFALPIRRQVSIPGVGRVDFLIGDRLVVEVDGATYHTATSRFEADRRRDASLSARGFRVLRFSYRQVMDRWHEVEAAVLAAVVRGDHH